MKNPEFRLHATRYPWDDWFAKDRFTLKQGRDYVVTSWSMMWMLKRAAKPRGVTITIDHDEDRKAVKVTVNHRAGRRRKK